MSRIADVPYYAQRDNQVSARLYNLWRRAKLHHKCPLRLSLASLSSSLVMLVEQHAWVCVDERQNDLPLLAWVDFQDRGRDALHQPVPCKLNYYHYAASRYRARSLELLEAALEKELREQPPATVLWRPKPR